MATATKKKGATKSDDATEDRKVGEVILVDIRKITSSHNHRNPLSSKFQAAGYYMYPADKPANSDKEESLWELGTSEDPAKRLEFCDLMKKYDVFEDNEKNDESGGIIEFAYNIRNVGLINPITIRANNNGQSYQLVAGHRRTLAVLFLWCMQLSKAKGPFIKAVVLTGQAYNNVSLQAMGISENIHRKSMTPMEQAAAYQQAINAGETVEEIANREGKSPQTIQNRISLLSLPKDFREKIDKRELGYTKALEVVKEIKSGDRDSEGKKKGGGSDNLSNSGTKRKMRSRKEVEERWRSAATIQERAILAWVLKEGMAGPSTAPAAGGSHEMAVLPLDDMLPGQVGVAGEVEEVEGGLLEEGMLEEAIVPEAPPEDAEEEVPAKRKK